MGEAQKTILVMGVCGSGKSTVAQGLAGALDGVFIEADDFHPPQNIEAMKQGIPLNDDMRWVWLRQMCGAAKAAERKDRGPVVIACSALKKSYRDFIRDQLGPVRILHLDGETGLIRARMAARPKHFMPLTLLESQIDDLEPPHPGDEDTQELDISGDKDMVVGQAISLIRRSVASAGAVDHNDPPRSPATFRKTQADDPQEEEKAC